MPINAARQINPKPHLSVFSLIFDNGRRIEIDNNSGCFYPMRFEINANRGILYSFLKFTEFDNKH